MSENKQQNPLIRADSAKKIPAATFSHPLNSNSEIHGVSMSEQAGLQRLGIYLVRIPPGKESFIYHCHQCKEDFIYILSGRGIAEIDDEEFKFFVGRYLLVDIYCQ